MLWPEFSRALTIYLDYLRWVWMKSRGRLQCISHPLVDQNAIQSLFIVLYQNLPVTDLNLERLQQGLPFSSARRFVNLRMLAFLMSIIFQHLTISAFLPVAENKPTRAVWAILILNHGGLLVWTCTPPLSSIIPAMWRSGGWRTGGLSKIYQAGLGNIPCRGYEQRKLWKNCAGGPVVHD